MRVTASLLGSVTVCGARSSRPLYSSTPSPLRHDVWITICSPTSGCRRLSSTVRTAPGRADLTILDPAPPSSPDLSIPLFPQPSAKFFTLAERSAASALRLLPRRNNDDAHAPLNETKPFCDAPRTPKMPLTHRNRRFPPPARKKTKRATNPSRSLTVLPAVGRERRPRRVPRSWHMGCFILAPSRQPPHTRLPQIPQQAGIKALDES